MRRYWFLIAAVLIVVVLLTALCNRSHAATFANVVRVGAAVPDTVPRWSLRRLSAGASAGFEMIHLDTDSTFGRHGGAFYNGYANWNLASRMSVNGGYERMFTKIEGLRPFSFVWGGVSLLLPGDKPTHRLYLKTDYVQYLAKQPFEQSRSWRAGLQYVWGTLQRKTYAPDGSIATRDVVYGFGRSLYDVKNGTTTIGAGLRVQPIGGK